MGEKPSEERRDGERTRREDDVRKPREAMRYKNT
jgi:hypothetical protein